MVVMLLPVSSETGVEQERVDARRRAPCTHRTTPRHIHIWFQ